MTVGTVRGLDLFALLAAVIAVAMAIVYVQVMHGQDDDPLAWVLIVLGASAVLASYGASLTAPRRQPVLIAAGVVLLLLGVLAIFTIGLPILVAGALALVASTRE